MAVTPVYQLVDVSTEYMFGNFPYKEPVEVVPPVTGSRGPLMCPDFAVMVQAAVNVVV